MEWLAQNAPEFHLVRATARLVAGYTYGSPTGRAVDVVLYSRDGKIVLEGEGHSYQEAVEAAMGGLR